MTWHLLAQSADAPLTEILKLVGGATFGGLAIAFLWLFISGRIGPTGPMQQLLQAERDRANKAEEREREAYKRVDRCLDALEAITPPPKAGGP
jgi:hypothetical protein